jgi:hypothetical protein
LYVHKLDDITILLTVIMNCKTNKYIRGKIYAQDMMLDDITRKKLIWYGHVERMDPTRLPKFMVHWKPEGRKKTRPSPENLVRWNIYSHE